MLLHLYQTTGGESWRYKYGWDEDGSAEDTDPGGWSGGGWWGMTTNAEGRVVKLELGSNNLVGESWQLLKLCNMLVLQIGATMRTYPFLVYRTNSKVSLKKSAYRCVLSSRESRGTCVCAENGDLIRPNVSKRGYGISDKDTVENNMPVMFDPTLGTSDTLYVFMK